jgi:2-oxoglutarate ferredoxin oxidoreductase subunit delta
MPLKGRIEVNENYCKACGLCVNACPSGVIQLAAERINSKGYRPVEQLAEGCTGCGICAVVCPEAAITVYRFENPASRGQLSNLAKKNQDQEA